MSDAVMLEEAVALLRSSGWTCIPPKGEGSEIPEPAPGQVWHSTKPNGRAQPRKIVKIGPARWYPDDVQCIYWVGADGGGQPSALAPWAWRAWVRKHNARPEV